MKDISTATQTVTSEYTKTIIKPTTLQTETEPAAVKTKSADEKTFSIPSLDGIRAFSFLLVFLSHAGLGNLLPGGFGVTIFFFLSGYLITTLLRLEYNLKETISLKQFYLRRAFRILPPFYVVLTVATLLTLVGVIPGTLTLPAILSQVFYYNNFYAVFNTFAGQAPGTGIFWSLAVEEHFYLLFPVAYLLLRRYLPSVKKQTLILVGVCALVLAWRVVLVYGFGTSEERTEFTTDTRLDALLLGCILAIYANPILDKARLDRKWWAYCLAPIGVVGLILSLVLRDQLYRESFRYSLQGVCLFPIFIAAIRCPDLWPYKILNFRWIRFMGTLSYSLYLVHFIYLSAISLRTNLPLPVQGILGMTLSLATAVAIYYTVERPMARLKKRLQARLAQAQS